MLLAWVLLAPLGTAAAQQVPVPLGIQTAPLSRPRQPLARQQSTTPARAAGTRDYGGALLAGLLGGVLGAIAGGYVGGWIAQPDCRSCFGALGGIFTGTVIGEGIGFGVASHLAAPGPSARKDILVPVAVSAGAIGLAFLLDNGWPIASVVPIQVVALHF